MQIILFLSSLDKVGSRYSINLLASVSGCLYAQQTIIFLHLGPVFTSVHSFSNSTSNAFK